MGMSDDLEAAIAEGATIVRVGTAIFGRRPAKPAFEPSRRPTPRRDALHSEIFTMLPTQSRLPFPYRPEAEVVAAALATLDGRLDWSAVVAAARPWVQGARDKPAPFWAMESLLREYPISSAEGLALMRLAEALLRVPDAETAIALTADQLGRADFDASCRRGAVPHAGQPVGERDRAVQALPARGRAAGRAA